MNERTEQTTPDCAAAPHDADTIKSQFVPCRRRWVRRLLVTAGILAVIFFGIPCLVGFTYRGPRDMDGVAAMMPGVPLFPLSTIAPGNLSTQRAMAIPLFIIRMQGVKRADIALLQAPADHEFVVDWYRMTAPRLQWMLVDQETLAQGSRLLFSRKHEGFQVIVGPTPEINTPVQLIYLNGLSERQLQQLIQMPGSVPPPSVHKEAQGQQAVKTLAELHHPLSE